MSIIVSELRCDGKEEAVSLAMKKIGVSSSEINFSAVYKMSKDARHKALSLVFSVIISLKDKDKEKKLAEKLRFVSYVSEETETVLSGEERLKNSPVIVGFGPAGMFAALILAERGYNPIVIERGADIDKRVKICEGFFSGGAFSERTNVQFGEGGAGTFSDGKLTTRINDPLCREVLIRLNGFGADEKILYEAKPHIGTDKLREIVKNIRLKIESLGGKVIFENKLVDINISGGKIKSIVTEKGEIETETLILAMGHSARDTFSMLNTKQIAMEEKPFSVGVRIEQKQEVINKAMYGEEYNSKVFGNAEYQLSLRKGERAVYTFCMCPGGVVVPAASEEEGLCVNGMSYSGRNLENANSALVVSVSGEDFGSELFSGINFQRELERKAYMLGGRKYSAPIEYASDFLGEKGEKTVLPSYPIAVEEADLKTLFPECVSSMLADGLLSFRRKIRDFDRGAVLTGVETRTSSPLRILRNENRESVSVKGLYPAGEGAGYAGGIMSAAVDGIKTANAVISKYAPIR